ncbi:hypothetical protein DMO24_19805 [Modestobacter versicolor]|uniref:Uncharacterized protein n=2 Tax=Modestobacter versicolor TaxID=429133 RepID=A0A323V6B3_9ACTN|nr:hypothetical protein DMO24_19805 [Modestobacter versicolor]
MGWHRRVPWARLWPTVPRGLPVDPEGGAAMTSVEAVRCHRCGHGYRAHQPACTTGASTGVGCRCDGFRWVDPAPAADVRGYHRPLP